MAALSLPVRAAVACALLVAGAALGAILTGFGMSGGNSGAPSAHRTAPATQPASPPPPPPGAAPSVLPSIAAGGPPAALSLNPVGDPDTGFVIHGVNWPPGTILTIALAGFGASPDHPVADAAGSFNYTINQSHEFRRGMLPPGAYQVTVTGSGGQRATVKFDIRNVAAAAGPVLAAVGAGGPAAAAAVTGSSTTGPPAGSTTPGRSGGPGRPR